MRLPAARPFPLRFFFLPPPSFLIKERIQEDGFLLVGKSRGSVSCRCSARGLVLYEHEGSVASSVFAASRSVASQTGLAKVKI